MSWYKIVDLKDGKPKTLFHGHTSGRFLPFGKWLEAEIKEVSDGSRGTPYMSGFHILPSVSDCLNYLRKFKNMAPKAIVECDAIIIWSKRHSRNPVFLAKYINIRKIVWKTAVNS